MSQNAAGKKGLKKKFVNDKHFDGYAKSNLIRAAKEMIVREDLSEEGFLGAQAILILNDVLP